MIALAGFDKKGDTLAWSLFESRVVKLLDLSPTFGLHISSRLDGIIPNRFIF
jgi:hypothetical protein